MEFGKNKNGIHRALKMQFLNLINCIRFMISISQKSFLIKLKWNPEKKKIESRIFQKIEVEQCAGTSRPSQKRAPPHVYICRSADHHRSRCSGRGSEHLPADTLLQFSEQPQEQGQHVNRQRQPQSSPQLRHGGHRQQGRLLPLLEVQESE